MIKMLNLFLFSLFFSACFSNNFFEKSEQILFENGYHYDEALKITEILKEMLEDVTHEISNKTQK